MVNDREKLSMQPLTEQLMETSMYDDTALGWMEDLTELYLFSSNINHYETYRTTRVHSVTLADTSLQIKVIKTLSSTLFVSNSAKFGHQAFVLLRNMITAML